MGIIQRQSLKFTVINFIGTFIGFLSVVFIYTLDQTNYGLFQSIHSYASLLLTILGLGIHGVIIRFYPVFVQKKLDSQYLTFTLWIATLTALISTSVLVVSYWFLKPFFFTIFDNFELVDDHKWTILGLGYLFLYAIIFLYHAIARFRIVIPDMVNNIGIKLFLPSLILLIYFGYVASAYFLYWIIAYYILVCLILLIYILSLGRHQLISKKNLFNADNYTGIPAFMLFSLFNGLGASLALRIDISMIGVMISKEAVALYSIIMVISNVMEIPAKAINQISSPVISQNWTQKDVVNIQDVYQKSSLYGLIAGLFLFLLLFFIWGDLLLLMPGKINLSLHEVLIIFSLLSAARIIDLTTGVNSVIISYSKHYKYHMYFLLLLAAINIVLNYLFLIKFGLIGAALATFIGYLFFNLMKYFFVKIKFSLFLNLHAHIKVGLATLILTLFISYINFPFVPIVNIIVKSSAITIMYGLMIWWLNPDQAIRHLVREMIVNYKLYLPIKK